MKGQAKYALLLVFAFNMSFGFVNKSNVRKPGNQYLSMLIINSAIDKDDIIEPNDRDEPKQSKQTNDDKEKEYSFEIWHLVVWVALIPLGLYLNNFIYKNKYKHLR